ncbi:regulatory protein GemA [Achromobacter xylosoxidans]|uniref:gp16 family protein n=1 Tax=Alcaligenes xylosoxydans xylosoxydans TaxID=85698 RepID=UPI001F05D97A|nr:regulatory protein GemA [Achromobacter xylosoxidans]MCH1985237.1 regulatory protein GemA [Achromobacter xylosoxidans]MCH1992911.1 regulatory protein GemA [Achromobacter xylosoxidans]MCH4575953.1 regulatory protein GemA [Achromobacter xylosoxidans]MCH4585626.1 regulatory protein GemA [Achromobacter xylosoxidans]
MATSSARGQERQRLIRLVHVAQRELKLDKETYRAALLTVTGGKKDSCSSMSAEELQLALDHFKRFGFKVRLKPRPGRPIDAEATSKKIRALWLLLRDLGAVSNPSEEALAAYVKRITGVEALQWIDGRQAERTIETMKKWAMRILPERVRHLVDQVRDRRLEPAVLGKLQAKLNLAFTRNTFDPMLEAFEALQAALNPRSTRP